MCVWAGMNKFHIMRIDHLVFRWVLRMFCIRFFFRNSFLSTFYYDMSSSEHSEVRPTGSFERSEVRPTGSSDRSEVRPTGSSEHSEVRPTGSSDRSEVRPTESPELFWILLVVFHRV